MVLSLASPPPIARRKRTGARPGPIERTGAIPAARRVLIPPPPAPGPEPAPPTTAVSDMCERGRHHRCRSTVLLAAVVDGKRYGPCGCPTPDCGHGSPRHR